MNETKARRKGIAIVSGGLDSVTAAWWAWKRRWDLTIVSFDYAQRHVKELDAARVLAAAMHAPWFKVDLSQLGMMLTGSALTDFSIDVPDGYYTDESMKATIVPNRNAIMISIAWGLAVARGAEAVIIGVHAGDHAIYPDCRPEFIEALDEALTLGNEGLQRELPGVGATVHIIAPFIHRTKAEIVTEGHALGVPFECTWSCYKGRALHCGTCGTCVERKEAFLLAGVEDPTKYGEAAL